MAFIRADGQGVHVSFPVGDDGYAKVTVLSLNLPFQFQEDSLYVEEKIFYLDSRKVTHAIGHLSFRTNEG